MIRYMVDDFELLEIINNEKLESVLTQEEISHLFTYIDKTTTELKTIKNRIKNYNDSNKELRNFVENLETYLKGVYG